MPTHCRRGSWKSIKNFPRVLAFRRVGHPRANAVRMMVSWGAVLQDKYVNARDVACCPTMDLIAVLTVDRQLIVHRTVSWQKMLHVKPTEVCFTFEVVVWSPDGMQLAVGCDEGEVVVYDIATGEHVELKAEESANDGRTAKRHSTCIVSMEWMRIQDGELTKSTPSSSWIQPEKAKGKTPDSAMTVLLTADDQGNVGFWWQGCVLVAMTRISDHLAAVGYGGVSPLTGLTIRSLKGTPDLAALFVVVSTMRLGAAREDPTPHHILRLNLAAMSTRKSSLSKVTHVAHEVRSILQTLRTTSRQMISEWKNATRIFELKMSLIGSLYEKYGREEPPQIDMLSIIAGGISPPALAQYFAQDIQEMSVHRMQKIFMSGCDTLRSLINSKMMRGLQQLLYHATELREDPVYSLGFYNDSNTRKHGNLVLTQGGPTKGFASMWRYEAIEFSPLRPFDHLNRNAVLQTSKVSASHLSSSEYPRHVLHNAFALGKARIFTQASRGIICVLLNDNRLIVLDAEDAGDEDGNPEIGLGHQDCSENESDVNEADL
ncbi:hypothetical protein Poli38472_005486 [Pythium oligandrum]|uniref:Anaphase-promoting complex subunit 4 n=1 Tax=Pythium oligandrum TaxID=41045 RepID=A0A8K1CH27_PYTOL|nr:hypothetical protein Poli38472_005486 [Pythium oligandrum]|eukprot:TMW62868.1 hypothetical protein Poli38472_005486 [Pythium oligandrum]